MIEIQLRSQYQYVKDKHVFIMWKLKSKES